MKFPDPIRMVVGKPVTMPRLAVDSGRKLASAVWETFFPEQVA